MFLVRKLLLTGALVLAISALAPGAVSAQLEVHNEDNPEQPCGTVTLEGTHDVQGGCHVEYQSTEHISLVVYIPSPTVVSNCNVHVEAQIGENGEGYVTEQELSDELVPPSPPCLRQACDEPASGPDAHATLAWPIHITEVAGVESIERTFCIRVGSPNEDPSAEGAGGATCTLHYEVTSLEGHNNEIGHDPGEEFCDPGSFPFPVAFRDVHFTDESESTDDVEIVH